MAVTLYIKRVVVAEIDEPPAGHENDQLEVDGTEIPSPKYGESQEVSPGDWDFYELGVGAASYTKPRDYAVTLIPGTTYQEWIKVEIPNEIEIPEDLLYVEPDPEPDPDDPLPQPYEDFYSRYVTFGPTIYDKFGYPVPREGAWQKLEDVGNPMVDRVLKLSTFEELRELGSGLQDSVDDIASRALDGNSPLEQAIRKMHRSSYDVVDKLGRAANFSGFPSNKGDADYEKEIDEVWWSAQREVNAAFNDLVAGGDVPALSSAPVAEKEMIRQALVAYGVGLGGDFGDEGSVIIYGQSGQLPLGDASFGGFWSIGGAIAGSILADRILLDMGKAFLGPGADRGIGQGDDSTCYGGTGDDYVTGGGGVDELYGDAGNDALSGDGSNDRVYGGAGRDVLRGGGNGNSTMGAEILHGDDGPDQIFGGSGRDFIVGGLGRDVMDGDGGNDLFFFDRVADSAVGKTRDVIADFDVAGGDQIFLYPIDAKPGRGNQKFDFIGSDQFSAPGQVRTVKKGSDTIVYLNTDLDHAAEMSVRLAGVKSKLSEAEFAL